MCVNNHVYVCRQSLITTVTNFRRNMVNKSLPVSCGTGADKTLREILGEDHILLDAHRGLPGGGGISAGPGRVNWTGSCVEGSSTGSRLAGVVVVFSHRLPSAVSHLLSLFAFCPRGWTSLIGSGRPISCFSLA